MFLRGYCFLVRVRIHSERRSVTLLPHLALHVHSIHLCNHTNPSHMHTAQNITDQKTQRQTGRQAQLSNIAAARAVADIIRTTLGPRSMLKVSPCLVYFAFLFPLSLSVYTWRE